MQKKHRRVVRLLILAAVVAIDIGIAWISSDASSEETRIAQAIVAFAALVILTGPVLDRLERACRWVGPKLRLRSRRAREDLAARLDPPRRLPLEDAHEGPVRGRDDVIRSVIGRVEREAVGAWCCYGFMGVGKSTVIRAIGKAANEELRLRWITGTFPTGPTRPSFCRVMESLVGWSVPGADEWVRLQQLAERLDDSIVVLDAFPHADDEAADQLVWFLSSLRERGVRCFFVLAAQERPQFPETAVECVELHGIKLPAFTAYCADLCTDAGREVLRDEQVATLYEKTEGNPQLARMAITHGDSASDELTIPEDEIESRVWSQASATVHEVLRILAALHRFEPEVPESELTEIIESWSDVRLELVKKNLNVPARPGTFKTHDLINTYVRQHNDAQVRLIHANLTRFYVESPYFESAGRPARLAGSHCAASGEPNLFAEHYVAIAQRLRNAGEAKALLTLAEAGEPLRRNLPDDVAELISFDLGWALAQVGETGQALTRLLELLENISNENGSTAARRAMLMRQIADCRRLRGDVAGAERDLRHAATVLAGHGLGADDEAVACLLAHAHCAYLAADPDESLRRLQEIHGLCRGRGFEAEWSYFESKAQRLRWDLDDALRAAGRTQRLAERYESPIDAAKGRWAQLAAERLVLEPADSDEYERLVALAETVKKEFTGLGYRAAIFIIHDIADLHRISGQHGLALERFEETQRLTAAMGETNREAHSWLGIAETIRAAGGELGEVGGAEHLRIYSFARSRYEDMRNPWGIALSTLGERLAAGESPAAAASMLVGSCCRGESQLIAGNGTDSVPLNFV